MSEFIIIHYRPGQESALQYWAMGGDLHPSITLGHGSLEEIKPIARGKKVSVLIDAHFTTLESVNIPSKNRSKQLLAIPFAMEDSLAEDIEDTHFALGKSEEDAVPVIAIKRSLLQHTIDTFKQYDIHPDTITADSVALIGTPDHWSILLDEDSALIKTSYSQAHSCDRENLCVILQALLDTQEEDDQAQPELITYYFKEDDEQAETMLNDFDIKIERHSYKNHSLEIFIQNLTEIPSLNLLQGDFTPVREGNLWLQPWKTAAAVAGVWLVLQLAYSSMQTSQLEQKNIALTKQIETEFKRALPTAKKISNMRKRVERKLSDLKSGGSGSGNSGFLQILSKVSPALSSNKKIQIKAAVYRNNYIDVDLTAKSLQDIEKIKNELAAIPGIKTVLSTTVEKNSVKGRLRLEAKG